MAKFHLAAALMALGGLAALPACSSPSYYPQYSSAAPMPATQELSPDMVRQVQTALQQQGLYNGAIDGIWGPQTQGAVQGFQQSHSLAQTGTLNSPTLAALNLPADNATPGAQSNAAPPPANTTANPPTQSNAATPNAPATAANPTAPATTAPP
jgi:peptidoglycan hydrolase-like protein with peptidoglycan-binding domain